MSAYQKLAQGRLVIKALESIATAGTDDKGLPKLAIARADAKVCRLTMFGDGGASMATGPAGRLPEQDHHLDVHFQFAPGTFPSARWRNAEAVVPHAPLHLRPKRAMQNYHVLFEAIWSKAPAVRSVSCYGGSARATSGSCGNVGSYRIEKAALSRPALTTKEDTND